MECTPVRLAECCSREDTGGVHATGFGLRTITGVTTHQWSLCLSLSVSLSLFLSLSLYLSLFLYVGAAFWVLTCAK